MKRLKENCHFERFDPSSFQNVKVFVNNKELPPNLFYCQGNKSQIKMWFGVG